MNEVSHRKWIYKLIAVVNFVLGFSSFLATRFILSLSIEISIAIAVSVVILLFGIAEILSNFTLHSRYLAPLRKRFLYWLSCVIIERWNLNLEIDEDGNAVVNNEIFGKVNFGNANWITLGIWAGEKQPKGKDFKIYVYDVKRQIQRDADYIIDEDTYKRFKIRFGQTLKRNDDFHLRVRYELKKTFLFDVDDYFKWDAVHHEKEVNIKVSFPETIKIEYVGGEIITENGDVWEEIEKPEMFDPQTITWQIKRALDGNSHKVYWKAKKRT
jgi:hypothetical protein